MVKKKKKVHQGLLSVLILLLSLWFSTAALGQYQVGDEVGNFTLKDVDGNDVSLYDYYGKVIVLNFFTLT